MQGFFDMHQYEDLSNHDASYVGFKDLYNQESSESSGEAYYEVYLEDGKKFYKCTAPDCGKIFRYNSEIIRHHVSHSSERPHMCTYKGCKKAFKRGDALKSHIRLHTEEVSFECPVPNCGHKFTTNPGLRYHLLKHQDEKPYKCSFLDCQKGFLTMTKLKQHEKTAHNLIRVAPIERQTQEPEEDIFSEAMEDYPKDKVLYDPAYFTPTPKPVKHIEWETKNSTHVESNLQPNENAQQKYETLVKNILNENQVLKHKLELCHKLMDIVKENNELKLQLGNASCTGCTTTNTVEEPHFFDETETNLMEFLKNNENQADEIDYGINLGSN